MIPFISQSIDRAEQTEVRNKQRLAKDLRSNVHIPSKIDAEKNKSIEYLLNIIQTCAIINKYLTRALTDAIIEVASPKECKRP